MIDAVQVDRRVAVRGQALEHAADRQVAGRVGQLDPAVLVTPPKGLEIGYVPIVTRQAKPEEK